MMFHVTFNNFPPKTDQFIYIERRFIIPFPDHVHTPNLGFIIALSHSSPQSLCWFYWCVNVCYSKQSLLRMGDPILIDQGQESFRPIN